MSRKLRMILDIFALIIFFAAILTFLFYSKRLGALIGLVTFIILVITTPGLDNWKKS